jgi:UPF0271 protein
MQEIYVLDASAILNFRLINLSMLQEAYTVPEVISELKDFHAQLIASSNQISVLEPETRYVLRVKRIAKDRGFLRKLSETDVKLLALALQLQHSRPGFRIVVLSDDYAVQNLAGLLHIAYRSLIRPGISEVKRKLIYVCPICGARCPGTRCPRCGSRCRPRFL